MAAKSSQEHFFTDAVDNRQVVRNLCASQAETPMTLFLTLTCNQSKHFGIRRIKSWIDSDEILQHWDSKTMEIDDQEKKELRKAIHQAAPTLLLCNWMETRSILMLYIAKSPENPLGHVIKMFWRDEFQDNVGNLPHVHALLCLKETMDTNEGREFLQNLIRASIGDIVREDEVDEYVQEGILESYDDYIDMMMDASTILQHKCSKQCMARTGTNDNELRCRTFDNYHQSPDHTSHCLVEFDPGHSQEATSILVALGLAEPGDSDSGAFKPLDERLRETRHILPTHPGEGIISPCNGLLFTETRSSQNLQICTTYSTSRYVAKYVASIDKNNYIMISVNPNDPHSLRTEKMFLHNTKVASSAMNEKERFKKRRDNFHPTARSISQMEMLQLILGYPQVHTDIEYVNISTLPLEERAGIERV